MMARSCTICTRADAGTINALLLERRSARSIASERGLSHRSLQRHAANHTERPAAVPTLLTARYQGSEGIGDPLDELVVALRVRALAGNPADTREYRLALAAQSAARHATAVRRSLADEPEWTTLRTRLLMILEPYPEVRQILADALESD